MKNLQKTRERVSWGIPEQAVWAVVGNEGQS